MVALDHPLGVGDAGLERRRVVVDHVAAEDRDVAVGRVLDVARARLHELARDPADLQHRQRRAVGEHGRHLEQDLQPLADRDGRVRGAGLGQALEVVERLGAVAGLEQERAARGDLGERVAHLARLAGEDERRQRVQAPNHAVCGVGVRPLRLLERLAFPPGRRGPGGIEDRHDFKCRAMKVNGVRRVRPVRIARQVRIFSGIQPTGAKHFGNYSGGFRQYAATQERAVDAGGRRSSASSTCTRSRSTSTRTTCASGRSTSRRCSSRPGSTRSARPSSRRAT